jgi:hypothetical protein
MRIAIVLNLAVFSLVVSQPLFYLIALTHAQRALSAPAYIELRQHVNAIMNRRLPPIYVAALLLDITVLLVAIRAGAVLETVTAATTLLALLADAFFMIRENVPINGVMDAWSTTSYPPDWEHYRARWFEIFRHRQLVLLSRSTTVELSPPES